MTARCGGRGVAMPDVRALSDYVKRGWVGGEISQEGADSECGPSFFGLEYPTGAAESLFETGEDRKESTGSK